MKDPEDVIEEFTMKMVLFSSIADGTDEGLIFSIAADFADECLTLIYSGSSNRFIFTTTGETGTESSRSRGLRG